MSIQPSHETNRSLDSQRPVARAVRAAIHSSTTAAPPAVAAASWLAMAAGLQAPVASAEDAVRLEEVVVTAQRRSQDLQTVPISVQVLGAEELEDLKIRGFSDYVDMIPAASYVSLAPGSSSLYMRGITSGGDGIMGSSPNAAVYLDEQPVTTVSRSLDPHIYDIARIESLPGPQGTLFGANAQSGAVRIITNAPDPTAFAAGYDVTGQQVTHGGAGFTIEGYLNIPITDRAALRIVGWREELPGYIDNVYGEHTYRRGYIRDRLNPETQADLIALASDLTVNNAGVVEKDFNEATTTGARAALKINLSDNWTATAGVIRQELDRQGVWDQDPDLGDLEVQRYMPDKSNDKWTQATLALHGKIAGVELDYAGSYLDRDVDYTSDYSAYSDYYIAGSLVESYYSCYVAYFGVCGDSRMWQTDKSQYKRNSHEVRLHSADSDRFRWLLGAFYEDSTHDFDQGWHVVGIPAAAAIDPPDTYWHVDMKRQDKETAFFGELAYDFTDALSGAVSARFFDHETTLKGFYGTIFWPVCCFKTDDNTDLKSTDNDHVLRASLSYKLNPDIMLYGTYSEGYRPGGINRVPNQNIDSVYQPDFLKSIEFGWKTMLLDGRMQFNGAVFFQSWNDIQLTNFDPSVSPIPLTDNVGKAESNGTELDLRYQVNPHWQLSGGLYYSFKAELSEDYWVRKREKDGTAPICATTGCPPDAPAGTRLPRTPDVKGNLSARFDSKPNSPEEYNFYGQGTVLHTGDSYNKLYGPSSGPQQRALQDAYSVLNLAFGLEHGNWTTELYVRNATDERGEVFINAVTWDQRVTVNTPRTYGLTFRQRF